MNGIFYAFLLLLKMRARAAWKSAECVKVKMANCITSNVSTTPELNWYSSRSISLSSKKSIILSKPTLHCLDISTFDNLNRQNWVLKAFCHLCLLSFTISSILIQKFCVKFLVTFWSRIFQEGTWESLRNTAQKWWQVKCICPHKL